MFYIVVIWDFQPSLQIFDCKRWYHNFIAYNFTICTMMVLNGRIHFEALCFLECRHEVFLVAKGFK